MALIERLAARKDRHSFDLQRPDLKLRLRRL
jgi:hypothetical protein